MKVFVIETGVANTAAVMAGLRRLGAEPMLTTNGRDVCDGQRVVLPGVGSFAAGMDALARAGLVEVVQERIRAGRPTLAICLGLQLMAQFSQESPGVVGLGIFDVPVTRLRALGDAQLRVPHMGWNRVTGLGGAGYAYFANSYKLDEIPAGWHGALVTHGAPFVAALVNRGVLACQFHPELSGDFGLGLMRAWLHQEIAVSSPDESGVGLRRRIIPCLDVRDGRIVKGVRFQGLRDAGDPRERAAAYQSQGGDELVVLDVSATREDRSTQIDTIRAVRRELSVPLTVGGGVRSAQDAGALLAAGADKVSVNTAAVLRPELVNEISARFGRQCTVIAIDAARVSEPGAIGWEVVIRAGTQRTGLDAIKWAREVVGRGAGELLLTSWDRDGTRSGYDLELVRAVADAVEVPVIASGGADTPLHMTDAMNAGAEAVLAASIFHDGHRTVASLKRELMALGGQVRP